MNISAKKEVSAPKSATAPSAKPLPAILTRPQFKRQNLKLKSIILTIILTTLLYACKEKMTFSNQSGSCKLHLHSDTTYSFTYPNFLYNKTENGIYKIYNDSIVLLRKSFDKIDSVDISYTCWQDNPDTLLLTFKNLYRNIINVKINLNGTDKVFQTDSLGEIIILYSELEKDGIVKKGEKIKEFKIIYDNKVFIPDLRPYKDSRKPDRLDFTLNQFIGEKYATLKRKYSIKNDTIFVNDISRKAIGLDNKRTYL